MASKSAQQEPEKAEVVEELLDTLDSLIDRVKVLYEQYFLGIQKQPPTYLHTDIERKIRDITQLQVRNTALRYRFATLSQKFGSYNAYWRRTLRQIENGTYTRNLSKIGRHAARTGAEVPEEILAAMPKRMREQVKRDRDAALALSRLRDHSPAPEAEADEPELLTLAEEHGVDVDLDDLDPAAFIKESTELRRNALTARGPFHLDASDDFDVDAFFAAVTSEGEPETPPTSAPSPRELPVAPASPTRASPQPALARTRTAHPRPGSLSGAPSSIAPGPSRVGALDGAPRGAAPLEAAGPSSAARGAAAAASAAVSGVAAPADAASATGARSAVVGPAASAPRGAAPAASASAAAARSAVVPVVVAPDAAASVSWEDSVTERRKPEPAAPQSLPAPARAAPVGALQPDAARPAGLAPSQATRPLPIAPGAAAARAPAAVESMSGPFPRLPSLPALPSTLRAGPRTPAPSGGAPATTAPAAVAPARAPDAPSPSSPRVPQPPRTPPPIPAQAVSTRPRAATPLPVDEPATEPVTMPRAPTPVPVDEAAPRVSQRVAVPRAPTPVPADEAAPRVSQRIALPRAPTSGNGAPPRPPAPRLPPRERPEPAPPQRPPPGMSEADVNALYANYVKAKQILGEETGPGAYGKLLKTINAQAPKIMEQYKAAGVDFSVVVKDNQVIIRAKPKP